VKPSEAEGRSVEEAVRRALSQTGWSRDRVDIEVLDEGGGLFAWLGGGRPARVRLRQRSAKVDLAVGLLKETVRIMGVGPAAVTARMEEDRIVLDARGPALGALIGRRGVVLDDLQRLINAILTKQGDDGPMVVMDVEGYRLRREVTLRRLAERLAGQVRRAGSPIALEPMSSRERRAIHLALKDDPHVTTRSEGEEPRRWVVIEPRRSGSSPDDGTG
jgi:spoIIIJ-associated protein